MKTETQPKVLQIRIVLQNIHPPVWRRVLVDEQTSLSNMHKTIQAAFGWTDSHLHEFSINGKKYTEPDDEDSVNPESMDENKFTLWQLKLSPRSEFFYEYDFGDGWIHKLNIEKVISEDQEKNLPRCIGGERACPPEDVGGFGGYHDFLECIKDPKNENHSRYLAWVGGSFDPEEFVIKEINERLSDVKYSHSRWAKYLPPEKNLLDKIVSISSKWNSHQIQKHAKIARALPLRQDLVSLITYIRDHKVVGTATTGNFPIKNVDEIGRLFVNPVATEFPIGETLYQARSEEEIWPVYIIHMLADALGLLRGCPGRRWRITSTGEEFLSMTPLEQTWALFVTWSKRFNWVDSYPENLFGNYLPLGFEHEVLTNLRKTSSGHSINFNLFVKKIGEKFFDWDSIAKVEYLRRLFGNFVHFSIIGVLELLGVVTTVRKQVPERPYASIISNFSVTETGHFFLNQVDTYFS